MHSGRISKLVPLTSQSELERAQLVRTHNESGHGFIDGDEGHAVYFSHEMVTDCPFHELWVGQQVDYELDPRDSERAQHVELVHADGAPGRSGVRMPPGEGYASTAELPGSPAEGNQTAGDNYAETEGDHSSKRLLSAIEKLERHLETPVVPGELLSWMVALQRPIDEVKRILPAVIQGEHCNTLQAISREDLELRRRVEKLRSADKRIVNDYGSFLQMYGRLRPAVESSEPDESKAEALIQEFVALGLQCVTGIRKQELALQTWFVEALERDRGSVD